MALLLTKLQSYLYPTVVCSSVETFPPTRNQRRTELWPKNTLAFITVIINWLT